MADIQFRSEDIVKILACLAQDIRFIILLVVLLFIILVFPKAFLFAMGKLLLDYFLTAFVLGIVAFECTAEARTARVWRSHHMIIWS